ncbi:hypothetical protein DEO72_LG1g206 [Vigna unguiculata]|uniref:Uncharacterized protein n=1 Tax=Vigna unguiculata TaxID=3917 RepID=A0A4D6KIP5_VIGUN|nr:hypothetical protein DEO72_LG1g206 [Vigna unguiculata]
MGRSSLSMVLSVVVLTFSWMMIESRIAVARVVPKSELPLDSKTALPTLPVPLPALPVTVPDLPVPVPDLPAPLPSLPVPLPPVPTTSLPSLPSLPLPTLKVEGVKIP